MRGLPCNHHRLGWVQHFFPSGEFRTLPFLDQFLGGLLDNLFLGGDGGYSHHTMRFGLLNWTGGHPLQRDYTFKNFSVQKGEVPLHLLSQLLHTFGQMVWLPPSRQIRLLNPILKGTGICYFLHPPYLSNISASEDNIWRQLEIPSKETQWGRGSLAVVLHFLHLTGPFGMIKQGSYFSC